MSDPAERYDLAALSRALAANGIATNGPLALVPLTGGQSNPTFRLEGADRPLVLRKKPDGHLLASAHAVDREFRIMRALHDSDVPVPRMYFYSDDVTILGTPFYVMEFLAGRTFEDQALPGMTPAERHAIYSEMLRVISALHRVDYLALGLSDFGRPGNYVVRQIARWTRAYRESETVVIPAMDRLIDWLPTHAPDDTTTSIVHGDFRLDNLIFAPDEPRVIGVIDWELATLGSPIADFSYHCMSRHIPADVWRGIGGLDVAALGIPSEADYIAGYAAATGLRADANWDFYLAYNLFRMAAILQGIAKRAEDGTAAAENAVETGRKARPLADIGWEFAQKHTARSGN